MLLETRGDYDFAHNLIDSIRDLTRAVREQMQAARVKTAFIKLHGAEEYEGKEIFVRPQAIYAMAVRNDVTFVQMKGEDDAFPAKETPQEIIELSGKC